MTVNHSQWLSFAVTVAAVACCIAEAFQAPLLGQRQFSKKCPRTSTSPSSAAAAAALHASIISSGDTVLVIGGTSGIGQLVTRKLAAAEPGISVRATSRSRARGEELLCSDSDKTARIMRRCKWWNSISYRTIRLPCKRPVRVPKPWSFPSVRPPFRH